MRLLAISFAVVLITQVAAAADAPLTRLATSGLGQVIEVRSIDDSASPFAGQYSDVDRWYYEHYTPTTTEEERRLSWEAGVEKPWPESYPSGWIALRLEVDADGWLVPLRQQLERTGYRPVGNTIRERILRNMEWPEPGVDELNRRYYFWAAGSLPVELRAQQQRMQLEHEAKDQPLIPAWLGTRPPLAAVFLPSGEILAYGELGLNIVGRPDDPMHDTPRGESWYRYSADGHLLQEWKYGEPFTWHSLLLDTEPLMRPWRQNHGFVSEHHIEGGYWAAVRGEIDPATRISHPVEVLAAFDHIGNPVDPDMPIPGGTHYNAMLHRSSLERIWNAQLALGLADPSVVSPYEGHPDGPRIADPTPRSGKLLAYRMPHEAKLKGSYGGSDMQHIEVHPLDDPASPYRGQYKEWDLWMMAQIGARDHRRDMAMNEEMRRLRQVAKLRKEGKPIPPELEKSVGPQAGMGEMYESDNPFHRYEIAVDEQGYIVPAAEAFRRAQAELFAFDYREYDVLRFDERFHLDANGVMPDDMLRAFELAKWSTVLDKYPPLPAWLLASPTYKAAVMPNGDIVTQGMPGSWNPDTSTQYEERYKQRDRNYYRFTRDGVLVAQTYLQEQEWPVLFNPAFKIFISEPETYGYGQHPGAASFFPVFNGVRGPIVAAYDYDGTQLKVDAPLLRPDGHGRFLTWQELTHLGWAQAAHTNQLAAER